jgi:hypothetical protein
MPAAGGTPAVPVHDLDRYRPRVPKLIAMAWVATRVVVRLNLHGMPLRGRGTGGYSMP